MTRRRRGGIKRGERDLAVINSLCTLHSLEHSGTFTELGREDSGEGGHRGDLREKEESQKEREQSSQ